MKGEPEMVSPFIFLKSVYILLNTKLYYERKY
jgi:hypothetical protein